jgi:hypothetical protein
MAREIIQAWKTVPLPEEWLAIVQNIDSSITEQSKWYDNVSVWKELWLIPSGFCTLNDNYFVDQGKMGYYWSLKRWYVFKGNETIIFPADDRKPSSWALVRCIKK